MAVAKNVAGAERTARVISGAVLVVGGLFLPGFWRPVSIVVGLALLLTAAVRY